MNLLKALFSILAMWRPAFCKEEAFIRAKELAVACLCAWGRKTITSLSIFLGRSLKLPVSDYKFYSECKWNVDDLFNPILRMMAQHTPSDYLSCAADDTRLWKTGKNISQARWYADPMGPKFGRANLKWGLRFLQMSVLLPLYRESGSTPSRAIPVRFIPAPYVKKPGKRSNEEEWNRYRRLVKTNNLSTLFVQKTQELRQALDQQGMAHKLLIMSCDGSFCNKTCMALDNPRIVLVARGRKNSKLCFPAVGKGRKVYGELKFTPEDIRKDPTIPWQKASFFYGGQWREMRYKEVINVLWQYGTKRKPLRLITLAPLPYIRGGKRNYRAPAYLLTTNLSIDLKIIVQAYLDRWQIEYNHRDEKSILGVGEAQVWNENSVERQPAFHVAAYSALLLANQIAYGDEEQEEFEMRPGWRKKPKRNTCRALVGLLRATLLEHPDELEEMGMTIPIISAILRQAA